MPKLPPPRSAPVVEPSVPWKEAEVYVATRINGSAKRVPTKAMVLGSLWVHPSVDDRTGYVVTAGGCSLAVVWFATAEEAITAAEILHRETPTIWSTAEGALLKAAVPVGLKEWIMRCRGARRVLPYQRSS